MNYLRTHCSFAPLTDELLSSMNAFSCTNAPEIATFFRDEAVLNEQELMSKSYCFYREDTKDIVCAFCVSNSNISTRTMTDEVKADFIEDIPDGKRRSFYPATLIGQLAVFDKFADQHIGDEFMDLIKVWILTEANQIGYRYLVVDAVNNQHVINYYLRNGFEMLIEDEAEEKQYRNIFGRKPLRTRFMTFDLTTLTIKH